jgi:hypothetical protein
MYYLKHEQDSEQDSEQECFIDFYRDIRLPLLTRIVKQLVKV